MDKNLLADPFWRLNNLYYIKDKQGERVKFQMNRAQRHAYKNMWYKNLYPKARQLGITTFIQLFMEDRVIFNDYTNAGVIAHKDKAAQKFFDEKIKFAYDNLPQQIQEAFPNVKSNVRELKLVNDSSIYVDTSLRSGTTQYLHVSEYGPMCAETPDKAREVRTGALNTVSPNMFIFIESTAAGRGNHFYDMCDTARKAQLAGHKLTKMDYKLSFYPWFWADEYVLHEDVYVPQEMREYFEMLEAENDIRLSQAQKAWYVKKADEQGDAMNEEYPSTFEEAFMKRLEGAIFAAQLRSVQTDGRILDLPHERGAPVNTFWDLGRNDNNAIWFHQRIGAYDRFINYYEHRLVDITHYIHILNEMKRKHGYEWGTMFLPHDGKSKHIEAIAGSAQDILRDNGFKVRVVDRTKDKMRSIEDTRKQFAHCQFDGKSCEQGLIHLENYCWTWDDKYETFRQTPLKNKHVHGADAFQTYGYGYKGESGQLSAQIQRLVGRVEKTIGKNLTRRSKRVKHNPLTNPEDTHIT